MWLTDKSRIEQGNKPNEWYLLDNEVFEDTDGSIYLVPRNFKTDNYTIPDWIAWLAGNKSKFDVRPSHIHDFGCEYHSLIKVNLSKNELVLNGYWRKHKEISICENIPAKHLSIVPVTKWQIDCLLKRAMKSTGVIPARVYDLYRAGVFFNISWRNHFRDFNIEKIYTREQ